MHRGKRTTKAYFIPKLHAIALSWGYSDSDKDGNLGYNDGLIPSIMDSGGGLISFVGLARYSALGTGGVYPTMPDGGPANRYYAGTFAFVPLPPTVLLLGSGLVGLGLLQFRRRRTKA
jgi:hypothetical protein